MRIVFKKGFYDNMVKSFTESGLLNKAGEPSKHGTGKHYETITIQRKDGTVYQRRQEVGRKKQEKKAKGKTEPKEETKKRSYAHTTGDRIVFEQDGQNFTGEIVTMGKDGVTVKGTGKAKGQVFRVRHENIRQVTKMINPNDAIRVLFDEFAIVSKWRGTDGMQPESCDTLKGLYETIEAARGEFSNFTDSITNEFAAFNPIVMKRDTLKSEKRIKEKLREDQKDIDYKAELKGEKSNPECYDKKTDTYHCRTIRDCDGHTICLNSTDEVAQVLRHLNDRKEVARLKNNFAKPTKVGYSDINCNVKLSNGAIVELQVNTTANMVAKERYGHALYEVYRSVNGNPKYDKLAEIMGEAQKALYKLSNKYSKEGTYPTDNIPKGKDGNANIFDGEYKHEPYAKAIREYVSKAMPLFEQAKSDGVLNSDTIEHFEHLIEYLK
jgi:hypothetical protein